MGRFCLLLALFGLASAARAEQPIFSEMPRWSGGWGVQVLQEYRHESGLYQGKRLLGSDLNRSAHLLHVEGVYTWDKSIRVTAKVPVMLSAQRRTLSDDGQPSTRKKTALGDPTIALPLKKYFNLDGRSGSWTLAPQVRVPGAKASSDPIGIYYREVGLGLSLGYETETYDYIIRTGLSSFTFLGDTPTLSHLELTLGLNFAFGDHNGHVKLHNRLRHWDGVEVTYTVGPIVYLRWTDLLHFQVRSTHDVFQTQTGKVHGKAHGARLGVGLVF